MASVGISGTWQKVELLLDSGADVNAADKKGRTALMAAVRSGGGTLEETKRLPVLKALLDKGAEVNAQSHHGRTALMSAAFRGLKETFKFLLDAGADFNLKDNTGRTALMYATQGCFWSYRHSGYISVIRYLLDAGADYSVKDNQGYTALKIARLNRRKDIANLLKKAGARE